MTVDTHKTLRTPLLGFNANLSTFLYCLYNWRGDLREVHKIETDKDVFRLIFWWLEWGSQAYGQIDPTLGISEPASKVLFTLTHTNDPRRPVPKIFELLWHERIDIQSNFPSLTSDSIFSDSYIDWCLAFGVDILRLASINDASLLGWLESIERIAPLPNAPTIQQKAVPQPYRLSLYGVPSLAIGIGEDARLLKKAAEQLGYAVDVIDRDSLKNLPKNPVQIFALPAPDILIMLGCLPDDILNSAYNIASCPWELPKWPTSLNFVFEIFDEVWVHSHFVLNSIPDWATKKVRLISLPVEVAQTKNLNREYFGLKEHLFYYMFSFDFSSSVFRKNPYLVVNAYRKMKAKYSQVGLIFKVSNSHNHPNEYSSFLKIISELPDTIVFTATMEKATLHDLYRCADCFVSLHRSEGFGRNLAEFMLLKKPVVTTAFSGNIDFCTEDSCFLVNFTMTPVRAHEYIFSEHQYWAEPDADAAYFQMESVLIAPDVVQRKAALAFARISTLYSTQSCANDVQKTLDKLLT